MYKKRNLPNRRDPKMVKGHFMLIMITRLFSSPSALVARWLGDNPIRFREGIKVVVLEILLKE